MRILQICSARTIGGGEKHLIDLAKALSQRGHNVYAAIAPRSPLLPELAFLPKQHITQLRLRNALDLPSALQLARFARKHEIEIIHAHIARDYTLAAFAVARNQGAQFIITRHVLFPLNRLHRLTLSTAARVISVSKAVAASLLDTGIIDKRKIAVIPNGIEINRFSDEAQSVHNDSLRQTGKRRAPLLVGTVGHLGFIKGHEDFVRAAALIAARRADVNFIIVGEDKSRHREQRARLEELIDELGLNERCQLVGWIEDVAPLLRTFDVFVSAAHAEPFGLAIVEAMASGVAVVATKSEGAREILDDGLTGKLFAIGDIEALAREIDSLLNDANARAQLGAQARRAAQERFSLEQMVSATEQIYKEALKLL